MRRTIDARRYVGHALVLAALVLALAVPVAMLRAQQTATGAALKPLVPAAASSVAANPDAFYGENVTLMAAVDEKLSPTVFVVDQDRTKQTGQTVLVVAPTLNGTLDLNTYITVIGEVFRFDPADVARRAKGYTLDIPADVIAKYQGRPAVLATAVINPAMVDLAKRLPPPMTAEDEALSRIMKRIGPAFTALRQGVQRSDADLSGQNVAVLKQAFAETEAFWKGQKRTDAVQWAQDGRRQSESIERALAAAKWEDVKAATTSLGEACQSCHGQYRERFDDGSYRIKTAAK